ncbi:hypothetical protein [Sinorhizobium meliloti]|nr:hypothetical protein HB772_28745 [Sinorhizobium meliloti]
MKETESCKGLSAFNDLADNYGHHLPGNPAYLFDWLLEQAPRHGADASRIRCGGQCGGEEVYPTGRRTSSRRTILAEHSK